MGLIRTFRTNFLGGEMTPRMNSRVDVALYEFGCETLRNFRQLVQGGVTRRPGTVYVDEINTLGAMHGASFVFSGTQAYAVFFSQTEANIYDQDGTACTNLTGAPWTAEMMPSIYTTQKGDTMIVTHEDMLPQIITRTGATTFTLTDFAFETHSSGHPIYQPYYKYADEAVTITPSATTGSITLTTSANYWTADHVGAVVRVAGKECTITSYSSATVVVATVNETLAGTGAVTDWDIQAFNLVNGYPRTCMFFDQRLLFGGSKDLPSTLFGSQISAYYNFDVGTGADNEAIFITIDNDRVRDIVGMAGVRDLQIFTSDSELYVPISATQPFAPTGITFKVQTDYGSAIRPVSFDGGTLFLSKKRTMLREFLYSDISQAYNANPLSYLSAHLLSNPIAMATQIESAGQPESYAYLLNDDGTLVVFMSVRTEKIATFTRWDTDGEILAIATADGPLFAVVERTINGMATRYIEYFDQSVTLDASKTSADTVEKASWPGFEHLRGTDVSVVGSGNQYLGDFTMPSDGILDLGDITDTEVTVGINYTPELTPLPLELSLRSGYTVGEPRRIVRVVLDMLETYAVAVNGANLVIRNASDDFSLPPNAVNGKREFYLLGWDLYGQPTLTQASPLPLTINGMMLEVEF